MSRLNQKKFDFVIIGAGVVGLCLSIQIKKRFKSRSVAVLEKESLCGYHASSRNSGVLHAGFYYDVDSLKARFARDGNRAMTEYCLSRNLPINQCGKLVVAKDESELESLDELLRRGRVNGVQLEELSSQEVKKIEPFANTHKKALYSPTTSSIDPSSVMKSLFEDAKSLGVDVLTNTRFINQSGNCVFTNKKNIIAGYVINCAGVYADKIAHAYKMGKDYKILPFKGLYLYSNKKNLRIKTLIYPVPNIKNPFLGVHVTVTVDGQVKIGPTAMPAFWREHYKGLDNFKLLEFMDIVARESSLMLNSNFDFLGLALEELKKYSKRYIRSKSKYLFSDVDINEFSRWGAPGIRAQLVGVKSRKLVMDYVVEKNNQSMHVLNVVSPGFTSAIPFSKYLCELLQ